MDELFGKSSRFGWKLARLTRTVAVSKFTAHHLHDLAGGHSSAGWLLEGPDEEAITGVLVNCSSNLFDVISLNSVTTPCFWRSLDANVDLAIEYSPVSFVGFNWVVVARLRFSGVSESVVASIVTHDVDEVEVVTSSLQWVHPHATVGASRLGIFVFSVIVSAN